MKAWKRRLHYSSTGQQDWVDERCLVEGGSVAVTVGGRRKSRKSVRRGRREIFQGGRRVRWNGWRWWWMVVDDVWASSWGLGAVGRLRCWRETVGCGLWVSVTYSTVREFTVVEFASTRMVGGWYLVSDLGTAPIVKVHKVPPLRAS